MTSRLIPAENDPIRPPTPPTIDFTLNGVPASCLAGQTIAGALLAAGQRTWRVTTTGERRGVFCGIGVCFDCIVTVGDERDVRACMRRVEAGDVITTQDDSAPTPDVFEVGLGAPS